jgi:hypothetical protein
MLFSRLIFPVLALILLLMAACAPVPLSPATESPESPVPARPSPDTPLVEPVETPTRRPSGITGDEDLPEAVENAIATFSQTLGSASREVTVVSYEEVTWSDSCLGLGGPDEACLQALTPGYLIQLEVDGEPVEVHTDARGVNVRVKGTKGPISIQPGANQPLPVLVALQSLSEAQNITLDQIEIVSVEEVEWSDSCLGLGGPAESCAAVVTPGFLIVLEAGGTEYEFHTDTTGENLRQK